MVKPTNQNLVKVPKLLSQQIRKRYYKTLGTSREREEQWAVY